MGIDITIIHQNGKDADDVFENGTYLHIASAIEFISKGKLSVGMRHECYNLIDEITDHHLTMKYDQENNIWETDDIKNMIKCLEYNVCHNLISFNNDVQYIKVFLEFLIKHKLRIQMW